MIDYNQVPLFSLIGVIFGGIVSFFIAFMGFKTKANTQDVSFWKKKCGFLAEDLILEKSRRIGSENKIANIKAAFKIVFNKYEKEFKDDPERMSMLKDLKDILYEID